MGFFVVQSFCRSVWPIFKTAVDVVDAVVDIVVDVVVYVVVDIVVYVVDDAVVDVTVDLH